MIGVEAARALQLDAELGGDELIFTDGVPMVSPARGVASPMHAAPPSPRPRTTIETVDLRGKSPVALASEQLNSLRAIADLDDFFAALGDLVLYRSEGSGPATVLPGAGPNNPKLLVVAGRFQPDDFELGAPLSGKCGEILGSLFSEASLQLNLCWRTALYKSAGSLGHAMLPREKAIFREIFKVEVALVRPERILVLGAPALDVLFGQKLEPAQAQEMEFAGIPLSMVWHPLQIAADPAKREETLAQLKALEKKIHGK